MSSARITFEVEGVKHSLYFGMVATEIITEKSIKAATVNEKSDIKSFAYIIHGGLCNAAELKDQEHPEFEEAYMIAESISSDNDLCAKIQSAWTASKPYTELMERLNGVKKKVEVKPKLKKPTGPK